MLFYMMADQMNCAFRNLPLEDHLKAAAGAPFATHENTRAGLDILSGNASPIPARRLYRSRFLGCARRVRRNSPESFPCPWARPAFQTPFGSQTRRAHAK